MIAVHTAKTLKSLTWNELRALHSRLGLKAIGKRADYEVRILDSQSQPVADAEVNIPTLTCETCPLARHIDGDRYCCTVSETATDVTRGHWEAKANCNEAIAKLEAETTEPATEVEAQIAPQKTAIYPQSAWPQSAWYIEMMTEIKDYQQTLPDAPKSGETPAPEVTAEPTEELPNRGDNGRGRVEAVTSQLVKLVSVPHAAKPKADDNFMSSMVKEDDFDKAFYNMTYLLECQLKAQLAVERTVIGSDDEAIALLELEKIDRDIEFYGRPASEPQPSPVVIQLENQMSELKKDVLSLFKITAFDPAILPVCNDEPEQPATQSEPEPEGTIHWTTPLRGVIVGKKGATRQFYVRNNEIFIMLSGEFTASETKHPNVRHHQIREAINLGSIFNPLIFKLSSNFERDTENYNGIGRIRQECDGRWWAWSPFGVTGHPFFSYELACKYLDLAADRHNQAQKQKVCAN